jgi:CRP-like cAMP-binding protein
VGPLERVLFLKTLGPLEALDLADIAVFAENAQEGQFAPGETILRAGERACSYHVITEGRVRAEGGEYPEPAVLGPRDGFGFLPMLAGLPEGLQATAEEATLTLMFEDDVIHDILEDHFSVLLNLVRNLARIMLVERRRIPPSTYLAPAEGLFQKTPERIDLVERIVLIRRPGSPFANSSLEALAQLARSTPEVRFREGQTVWRIGEPSPLMYVIVSGRIVCTGADGAVLFRAGPGYPLGNLERLCGQPRWFTAVCETPVVALRGDTEDFLDILEDHFDMARDFVSAMARNLIALRREIARQGESPLPLPEALKVTS